jgi:cell division protein FtsB
MRCFLSRGVGAAFFRKKIPVASAADQACFIDSMPAKSSGPKERVVLLMLLGVLLALVVFLGGLLLQTYRKYENFRARELRIEQKLAQARKEFDRKEAYLLRLMEDGEFLERVARERLGYARPDELLFRFPPGGEVEVGSPGRF